MAERKININPWLERFKRECGFKNSIILSGNTSDIMFNPNGAVYSPISDVVYQHIEEMKYENIIVWDSVDGIDREKSKMTDKISYLETENNTPKNQAPFNAYLDDDDKKDIESQQTDNLPNIKPGDVEGFFTYMLNLLKSDAKPTAFLLNYSDYLFGNANNLSEKERSHLLKLNKALQSLRIDPNDKSELRHLIIIITKEQATIPLSYYKNNPLVSMIHIPLPGRLEREEYIKAYELAIFTASDISNSIVLANFVDSLDGFTLKEIAQIIIFARQNRDSNLTLEKLVSLYKYGEKNSPWEELSKEKIEGIEDALKKRVKGQDDAVDKVKSVIIRAYTGFSGLQHSAKQKKPKGTLFFVGPTGVGKTELAKSIAEFIFGDETACIRFDMSEFSQEHSDQRLIGAPPGYVGYEEGGQLTNAVKNKPFCVLLFDEIEKAHPRILDKFLQILEDGRLTDSKGETVYFSETFIIFTSNIGAATVKQEDEPENIKKQFKDAVENYFKSEKMNRPELLNRIGNNIVSFNFIKDKAVFTSIAKSKFEPVKKFIKEKYDATLKFIDEDKAFKAIAEKASIANGGRGVLNIIESCLIDPLSDYVFLNDVTGETIIIKQFGDAARFSFDLE